MDIKKSITVYYCSCRDIYIDDIEKTSYHQLKELLNHKGDKYAFLSLLVTRYENGEFMYDFHDNIDGDDDNYIEKLCEWFDCSNIKELEMKVKLKK